MGDDQRIKRGRVGKETRRVDMSTNNVEELRRIQLDGHVERALRTEEWGFLG
jgi:hypothetical protein